jgi:uncharacterized protein (TIGR00299 family) protein
MRVAYVDCFSGASGDMLLGALLDAGLELDALAAAVEHLGLEGYELQVERQVRQGVRGSKFSVQEQGHDGPARNLAAVRQIIGTSGLPEPVVANSLQVFQRLAEAEATVHGLSPEEVHFHELSAVDTLVDVVGFCWALHHLEIEALYASPLPLGGGTIRTQHGLLPVPAPATLALLAAVGAPIVPSEAKGELVTPTGAALLCTLATFAQPAMTIQRVGYGFGSQEFPWPNVLRVWIGEALPQPHAPRGSMAVPAVHHHDHGEDHASAHDPGPEHAHGAGHHH